MKTVRNGNSRSSKKAVPVSDDSFDLEISPDEIRDARKEEDENLPGQMQFGMEEKKIWKRVFWRKTSLKKKRLVQVRNP